ncbi:MAG: hypothetical protein QGH13_02665 [Candidatus Thalassarchaeaceae archaeon]|nr:hypothetical protein [Candidatus Thalassarchaeaceae archaeon]
MSDEETPPMPPGISAPPMPPGMPPAPPGMPPAPPMDAPPAPPGMPPAPPMDAPPAPPGMPPAPPMDAPPAPPMMDAPPAPPMDAPPAPPMMDAPPAPPMDAPPAPPMMDAPPAPPMDAPPAPPMMDAPPAPPEMPPAPPVEDDLLGDLGASLAADLLAPTTEDTDVEDVDVENVEEDSEEDSDVQVSDALDSMSIDSEPVDAGSMNDPLSVPTADHTGARVRPLNVVDGIIGDKLSVHLHEVEKTSVSSDGTVLKQSVEGSLALQNPSEKDRLWDLDIYLDGNDHTDLDPHIKMRELEAGSDESFNYSVKGPQMLKISEVVDTHPERDQKPSASLSHSEEAVPVTVKVTLENTSSCVLNNVTVTKSVPSQFTYVEGDAYDLEGSNLVWNVGSLSAGSSISLDLSASVIADAVGSFDAGVTTATYDADATLSGMNFVEVDSCAKCFSYMNANEGERPDTWSCQAVFENKSSFAVDLVLLRVNVAGEDEPLFDIVDVPEDVRPSGRWESDEKHVDSRDQPNFSQELTYSVIPKAIRTTSGTLTMEPTMLSVLEAEVTKAMDLAVLKSYREADVNVELKVSNTGSATINLMRITDDVPGLFTTPESESISIDIDGDALLPEMFKVEVKDGVSIEETHLSPDGAGSTLRITVGTKGPIGLESNSTLRVSYKLNAPDPSPENNLVAAPVRVDFSAEKTGPITTRGAEDVPTLRVSHKRRKFNTGKQVFPAGGAGRYEVLVMFHNQSDTALEDLTIHDIIPHGFELKSTRIDSSMGNDHDTSNAAEDHEQGTKVVWNIGVIEKGERIEIMYEILGDSDAEYDVKSAQQFHGAVFGDEIDEDFNNQSPALIVEENESADDSEEEAAEEEATEEEAPAKEMGFSDNVLNQVMKKFSIEDREGFISHAANFDHDGNNYLNKTELTNAAEAWESSEEVAEEEAAEEEAAEEEAVEEEAAEEEAVEEEAAEEEAAEEEAAEEEAAEEEAIEEEAAEEEAAEEDNQDSLMDAMMSKLMEDSFTGGEEDLVAPPAPPMDAPPAPPGMPPAPPMDAPPAPPGMPPAPPMGAPPAPPGMPPAPSSNCPICNAENPAGSSMCGTCSYTF